MTARNTYGQEPLSLAALVFPELGVLTPRRVRVLVRTKSVELDGLGGISNS